MVKPIIAASLAVLFAAGGLPAVASEPAEHEHEHGMVEHEHGHEHGTEGYSAGEPGSPQEPSREIRVTLEERDGKMLFVPDHIGVRKGEQIKFVLSNKGELEHEFVLATAGENREHAEAMKKIQRWRTKSQMRGVLLRSKTTRSSGNSPSLASSNTHV